MKRARALEVICLASTFLIAGCWSRHEITEIARVSAVSVDLAESGMVRVCGVFEHPKRSESGRAREGEIVIEGEESSSVLGAVRRLNTRSSRKPFWAHANVMVIGEDLAKNGIASVLDWFDRDPQPRRLMWILIAEGKAEDILTGISSKEEMSPGEVLADTVRTRTEASLAYVANMHDFLTAYESDSRDPVVGRVRLSRHPSGGIDPQILGAAVFREDKMVGWLDEVEARGLLWVTNKVSRGAIEIPSLGQDGRSVGLDILLSKCVLEVSQDERGSPRLQVRVRVDTYLDDLPANLDVRDRDVISLIESEGAKVVTGEILAAIKKCRDEYGADVFGFGEEIHRQLPRLWRSIEKEWRDVYRSLPTEVEVSLKISRVGGTSMRARPEK